MAILELQRTALTLAFSGPDAGIQVHQTTVGAVPCIYTSAVPVCAEGRTPSAQETNHRLDQSS